jgi:hypothetical protein
LRGVDNSDSEILKLRISIRSLLALQLVLQKALHSVNMEGSEKAQMERRASMGISPLVF